MKSNPYIAVHTLTYNEETIIKFFIEHYRKQFPNCIIKIWDNHSTDNTVKIAQEMGCEIFYYDSDGFFNEKIKNELQNKCWKNATTEWVVVCDCDELIQISQDELIEINNQNKNTSILKFKGYTLVHRGESIDLAGMKMGFYDKAYDKTYLFKKTNISEINYSLGCHYINPIITVPRNELVYTNKTYSAHHYKYLSLEYSVNRRKLYAERLSEWSKNISASFEVIATKEYLHKNNFKHLDIEYLYTEQELIQVIE